jgi:hypothetical protein
MTTDSEKKPELDHNHSESCFLFHAWTKWGDVKIVKLGVGEDNKHIADRLVQMKTCKRCNMKKYREETVWSAQRTPM